MAKREQNRMIAERSETSKLHHRIFYSITTTYLLQNYNINLYYNRLIQNWKLEIKWKLLLLEAKYAKHKIRVVLFRGILNSYLDTDVGNYDYESDYAVRKVWHSSSRQNWQKPKERIAAAVIRFTFAVSRVCAIIRSALISLVYWNTIGILCNEIEWKIVAVKMSNQKTLQ